MPLVTPPRPVPTLDPSTGRRLEAQCPCSQNDAVIGGDTHRDTHALEIATPTGATISTLEIGNDPTGFAEAVGWITQHAPGPRVVVGLEGTRSYSVGLTRA